MNTLFRKNKKMERRGEMETSLEPFYYGPDPFPADQLHWLYGSIHKEVYCRVCHERLNRRLYHRHHSSLFFHETSARLYGPTVNCPTCKINHAVPSENQGRTILLYTTSTLHNVFLNRNVRLHFHIDIESICGGKIIQLFNAWRHTYRLHTNPTDIVVVAGLNDVADLTSDQFMGVVEAWNYEVREVNRDSSFRICKLLRPPSLAWFPGDGEPPTPTYINYLTRINNYNQMIDEFNLKNGNQGVVGFHLEGCRGGGGRVRHNFNAWREVRMGRERCLHLSEPKRTSMFKKLARYIETRIIPNH